MQSFRFSCFWALLTLVSVRQNFWWEGIFFVSKSNHSSLKKFWVTWILDYTSFNCRAHAQQEMAAFFKWRLWFEGTIYIHVQRNLECCSHKVNNCRSVRSRQFSWHICCCSAEIWNSSKPCSKNNTVCLFVVLVMWKTDSLHSHWWGDWSPMYMGVVWSLIHSWITNSCFFVNYERFPFQISLNKVSVYAEMGPVQNGTLYVYLRHGSIYMYVITTAK